MSDLFDAERLRAKARLTAAGWRQSWSGYWHSPDGNQVLREEDAVKLLPPDERKDVGDGRDEH